MKLPKIDYHLAKITLDEWDLLYKKHLSYLIPYRYRYFSITPTVFVFHASIYSYSEYANGEIVYKKGDFNYFRGLPYFYGYNSEVISEKEYDEAFSKVRRYLPLDIPSNFHKKIYNPKINYIYYDKLMKTLKKRYNTYRISKSRFVRDSTHTININLINDISGYGERHTINGIKRWETPLDNIDFILTERILYLSIKDVNKLYEISNNKYLKIYNNSVNLFQGE